MTLGEAMPRKLLIMLLALLVPVAAGASDPARRQVDVGGHRLSVTGTGQGRPTVVLESGGGGDIRSWKAILPRIGEFTSVVAYARAGHEDSEPANTPRTLMVVVEELRTLLRKDGCEPPYVLVGRSLGGIYVRAFAMKYPTEVAGLVLVDGSHERQGIEYARATGITVQDYLNMVRASVKDGAARREMEGLESVMASGDLGIVTKLPDTPLVVITNTRADGPEAARTAWRALQNEVFESTTQGRHIVTNRSGHDIGSNEPDLVVEAVRWTVDTVRRNGR